MTGTPRHKSTCRLPLMFHIDWEADIKIGNGSGCLLSLMVKRNPKFWNHTNPDYSIFLPPLLKLGPHLAACLKEELYLGTWLSRRELWSASTRWRYLARSAEAERGESLQSTEGTRKNPSFPCGGHSSLPVSPVRPHVILTSARTWSGKMERSFPNIRSRFSELQTG